MSTKKSVITRVLDFFREGDADQVRVTAILAAEILGKRGILVPAVSPPVKGGASVPKKRRTRPNGTEAAPATEGQGEQA